MSERTNTALFVTDPSGLIPVEPERLAHRRAQIKPALDFSPLQWLVRPPRLLVLRPLFYLFDLLSSLAVGFVYFLFSLQATDARYSLVRFIAWVIRRPIQRSILGRLRLIFADEPPDEIRSRALWREFIHHVGLSLVEPLRLARMSTPELRQHITVEGEDRLRAALAQGRGVVLFTNHLAESGAVAGLGRFGYDITIVTDRMPIPYFERLLKRLYEAACATRLTAGGRVSFQAGEVLARNGVLALYSDLSLTRRHGKWVPFGEAEIRLHPGPAVIAVRNGAPVLYATSVRLPENRHHVTISEPLPYDPHGEMCSQVGALLEQSAALLYRAVRANPAQWWALDFVELRPARERNSRTTTFDAARAA